jgi:hypothetical protein
LLGKRAKQVEEDEAKIVTEVVEWATSLAVPHADEATTEVFA